jgi:hypothetical protein
MATPLLDEFKLIKVYIKALTVIIVDIGEPFLTIDAPDFAGEPSILVGPRHALTY